MNLLIFDNYDSFTYNIAHAVRELGVQPDVVRNDRITLDEIAAYDKIIISPGPGIPSEAGILPQLLLEYAGKKPYWVYALAIRPSANAMVQNCATSRKSITESRLRLRSS